MSKVTDGKNGKTDEKTTIKTWDLLVTTYYRGVSFIYFVSAKDREI